MDDAEKAFLIDELAKSLESDLLGRYGPVMSGDELLRALGYPSKEAFRQSLTLRSHAKALAYLQGRGIYQPDLLATFRLGFADRSLGAQLRKLSHLQEETVRGALLRVGLLKGSGHELFRGALVFPMLDQDGRILGGYGRRITPKLTAHSAYHVHWHLDHKGFFNQKALFEFSELILCKSPVEALTWWCHGYTNVAAIMGFSGFNDEHLSILRSSLVRRVLPR